MFTETIPSEGLEDLQLSAFKYNTCKAITPDFMSFFDFNFSLMIGFTLSVIRISPGYFLPVECFWLIALKISLTKQRDKNYKLATRKHTLSL
jgi:hypothetical protein